MAKKIGAIFNLTSACTGSNINILFQNIGKKLIESKQKKRTKSKNKKNKKENNENIINNKILDHKKYDNEDNISGRDSLKLESNTIKNGKKKKCC